MYIRKAILTSIFGNVVEWYDFALIAYLSPILSQVIFVKTDPIVALLSTLLVYALGFMIRPLGAVIFGHIGDKFGRAIVLKLSISVIAVVTLLMSLVPGYQSIGIVSPIIFALLRLLQGLALGGEFAGTMIYLCEVSPNNRKALYSSMANNGSNLGVLFAAMTSTVLATFSSQDFMLLWGWRIAFAFGGFIGLLGLIFRKNIYETDSFLSLEHIPKSPIRKVWRQDRREIIHVACLLVMSASGSYLLMGYISTYLHMFLGYPLVSALKIQSYLILSTFIFVPVFGWVSDKYGRRPVLYFAVIAYIFLSLPCFMLLEKQHGWLLLLPLLIAYSAEQSTTPAVMVEHFPINGRYTGISLSYNISMAVIGGLAPYLCTYLIHQMGTHLILPILMILAAMITFKVVPYVASV